jgi:hypothetical protein
MPKWLILLSALLVTPVSGAPAWTWVDANGTVHFSDTPVPGARQIELTGAQGFGAPPPPPVQAPATASSRPSSTTQSTQPTSPYRAINIVSPAQQETLWNTGGNLNVQVALEPRLQPSHRLDLMLDGQRRNLNATGLQLSIQEVFRGVHTLSAVIVDASGMEIARSPATTFTVQQTSIQNPNAPLARRPGNGGGN